MKIRRIQPHPSTLPGKVTDKRFIKILANAITKGMRIDLAVARRIEG